ncbi:hypothetical protein BLNAU_15357 [Blattamonas nauphoetae]|uniref:Uncharacterized protein n=1 Tax=Blattamonas nauphoetae TaxID=2049346 RepID=A0ABQ9XAY0_9EUKA|nr:hypothetical protein BLNAU_15357 [Blattamonas nauphoetae]
MSISSFEVRTQEENELFAQRTLNPKPVPHNPVPMSWFVLLETLLPITRSHTQLPTPKLFLLPLPSTELLVTFKISLDLNSVEISPIRE